MRLQNIMSWGTHMKRIFKSLAFIGLILLVSLETQAGQFNLDFHTLEKGKLTSMFQHKDLIIFETETRYLLKTPLTNFESYDYYYLQLPEHQEDHPWYFENTNVVYEQPGEFLVVEVRNEKQLLEVASKAHHQGGFCGMLQKLSPDSLVFEKKQAPVMVQEQIKEVKAATALVNIDNIIKTMETMVSWETRVESETVGLETAPRLIEMFKKLIPEDRNDVEIELVDHNGSKQQSYVVRIKGSENPEKIVILGSHIDSMNRNDLKDAPGADDNASGTATNMEVFRVLMESKFVPKNTLEIHGYGAEEIGLVGSKEMAQAYKAANKQVLSMVQFDMNGYASSGDKITFITNNTNAGLTSQLENLVKMYNEIPSAKGRLFFGSSDHASWNREGFPVAFPTENPFGFNRKIHTKDDTMAGINSTNQIKEFGKLGVAYFMHFGS